MKNKLPVPQRSDMKQLVANIAAAERATAEAPYTGENKHGVITAANDSLLTEAYFSQPLTSFAVGWRDPNNIEAALEFFAPKVPTSRRFEYASFVNVEEFYSETDDDLRAIGADFKQVEYRSSKVLGKTDNRGLRIVVDLDQVAELPNWQEMYVGKLMRRLKRNALRRAFALLSAAATNTAKTWDTSADPDQDVISELVTAVTASGVMPSRAGYGHTAWSKRSLALRGGSNAGKFATSGFTPEQLAGLLGLDQVYVSKERYQSSASAKSEIVGTKVLMFTAASGQDTEDPSNIKRFVSGVDGGGDVRVYSKQINSKLWEIVVEHYESIKITSTLGIRQFTVS